MSMPLQSTAGRHGRYDVAEYVVDVHDSSLKARDDGWQGRVDEPLPMDLAFELDDDGMGVCVLETTDDEVVRTCTMDMIKKQEELHTPGIVSSGTDWNSVQAQ
eukprot:scaffold3158_cov389-Prasinococcus_capsulatus_cf.AAC.6